jgi:hypothetical protein
MKPRDLRGWIAMPHFAYNVVYIRGTVRSVERHLEYHDFPGGAREFARATLQAWLERAGEHPDQFAVVNVWDADRGGVGVAGNIIASADSDDLDKGPFDPDQIWLSFAHYHVVSAGYDMFGADPVLGFHGTSYVYGRPPGLIVAGQGPALRVMAGHKSGWITLQVALHGTQPPADTTRWEAVEEATVTPVGEVRVADHTGNVHQHYPDLTGGRDLAHLTIRISVRGREARPTPGAGSQRRRPLEHHLIETWPATAMLPRRVLKRDGLSRSDEGYPS